jgi:hypothetical protein
MTKTLKTLITAGLISTAATSMAIANPQIQFEDGQQSGGQFTSDDPQVYDLGSDLAVVFYYDNPQGERVVVTTVGPKDPDSGRPASQHIVTLTEGEVYQATLESSDPTTEAINVTVRFDWDLTRTLANH